MAAGCLLFAAAAVAVVGQTATPPPSSVGVFPLDQVHRGLKGVAWTVFEGSTPEPMDVEILGVQRGAIGPGKDMILARLVGVKPEYTGVVAGMSGSPVYIDGKLLGALSYRIGQFSKEPIAGITPIAEMFEVRDLPEHGRADAPIENASLSTANETPSYTAMDTPLTMSGFNASAIRVWKDRMAGTGLDVVSIGGGSGSSASAAAPEDTAPVLPGSAVSLQLVRGDMEIAATCTVTYIDPTQLLACGHPVMQSGPVSLPMTTADVIATLPSPMNAFKIVNTGRTIGAFTEDRATAIRGELGAKAHMIPVTVAVNEGAKTVGHKIEVVDLPSLTSSAVLVSVYQMLLETNLSASVMSYHVTGEIRVKGMSPIPVNAWGTPGDTMVSQLAAAFAVGDSFNRLYANGSRLQPIEGVTLHVDAIPHDLRTELESARVVSSGIVHAGDTVMVEVTLRQWQQPARNLRLPITIPGRLEPGNLRLMVGSAASLDRTLEAAQPAARQPSLEAATSRLRGLHDASHVYASLLLPESQASTDGVTLTGLPLSMANTLEPQRSGAPEVGLHGESLVVVDDAPVDGVVTGQQILTLRVEAGGGAGNGLGNNLGNRLN